MAAKWSRLDGSTLEYDIMVKSGQEHTRCYTNLVNVIASPFLFRIRNYWYDRNVQKKRKHPLLENEIRCLQHLLKMIRCMSIATLLYGYD